MRILSILLAALLFTASGAVAQKPTAAQLEALRAYVHPLRTVVPDDGDDSDLAVLKTMLADARIVGLGEATHGTREIFQMKDRLVRYLAQHMDFDIFSIEDQLAGVTEVNRYILGGEGGWNWGMSQGFFSTEATREMIEWMRRYNDGQPKIAFTGFDMQVPKGAYRTLRAFFEGDSVAQKRIERLQQAVDKIDKTAQSRAIKKMWAPLRRNAKEFALIRDSLQAAIDASPHKAAEKAWASQNLRVIEQLTEAFREGLTYFAFDRGRDRFMAENIGWIQKHSPGAKMVLWAHNAHIQDGRIIGKGPAMGAHLKKAFGPDYAAVGFALGEGTYTARERSEGRVTSDNVLASPDPKSYEYIFSLLGEEIFLLDLKRMKADNSEAMKWFLRPHRFRTIGAMAEGAKQNYGFLHREKIGDRFDYLIYIRHSTASRMLPQTK
jgi:erythromycin esterase